MRFCFAVTFSVAFILTITLAHDRAITEPAKPEAVCCRSFAEVHSLGPGGPIETRWFFNTDLKEPPSFSILSLKKRLVVLELERINLSIRCDPDRGVIARADQEGTEAMSRIAESPALRAKLSTASLERAKRFAWGETSRRTFQTNQSLASENRV
jgi:hypothetical protein